MAMVIAVGTTFAMTPGILGAFCVRVLVSYLTSRRVRGNLFRIGMATPASSLVQTALCVLYYIRANKFLQKQTEKPVFRSNSSRNPSPGNERLYIFDFKTNGLSIYIYSLQRLLHDALREPRANAFLFRSAGDIGKAGLNMFRLPGRFLICQQWATPYA